MYTLISIFYVSLLGMLLMLFLKAREVNTGKESLVSRLGSGTDHVFAAVFGTMGRGIRAFNKHTFIWLAQWVAIHVVKHVRAAYVELKDKALKNPHTKKVIDAVRGRGQVSQHGASFYLRRISADDRK